MAKKKKTKVKKGARTTIVREHPRHVPLSEKNPGFRADPAENRKIALGIIQITKSTLKILLDPKGEVKDFTFKDVRQKDLRDPAISIPLGVRWLFRKRATAKSKLNRTPTDTELILEYKGLLKSKTEWKRKALESYQKHYKALKSE